MVKQQRRTDRCFLPAAGNNVALVRFPVVPTQRRWPPPHQGSVRKWAGSGTGNTASRQHVSCSTSTGEERRDKCGDPGPDGASGETKRAKLFRAAESAGSCDQPAREGCSLGSVGDGVLSGVCPPELLGVRGQGSAEHSKDNRSAELQGVGSLKVTIQQSSESREFGQTDSAADSLTGGLHCHVCKHTYCSVQVFHEHMSGAEHKRKLQEITHSISLTAHTLKDRGRRPHTQRWCDTCQTHFSGDVIIHRRTKQHKMCKQLCRPFCPVCKRHFRTPRKFVEHMKSPEHKQQVNLHEAQEEELITVDAVGCFMGEEEEEGEEETEAADDEEEESKAGDKVLQPIRSDTLLPSAGT